MRPDGGLGAEHDRVGAVVDRCGDVRDLGTRRRRTLDHRFQHLRGDDDRLGRGAAPARQPLLDRRQHLDRKFDAQIAPRNHDPVGLLEDFVEALHCGGLLDLRHHGGAPRGERARLGDVLGTLDEAERKPVDSEFARKLQIVAVLLRKRRQRKRDVGHVDALVIGDHPSDDHLRVGEAVADAGNAQPDPSVVHEQNHARPKRLEYLGMGKADPCRVALRLVEVNAKGGAWLERPLGVGEHAHPELRSLQIGENADGTAEILLDPADRAVPLGLLVMVAMAHVEAEHVGAGLVQGTDRFVVAGHRAKRGHDLQLAMAAHGGAPVPVRLSERTPPPGRESGPALARCRGGGML